MHLTNSSPWREAFSRLDRFIIISLPATNNPFPYSRSIPSTPIINCYKYLILEVLIRAKRPNFCPVLTETYEIIQVSRHILSGDISAAVPTIEPKSDQRNISISFRTAIMRRLWQKIPHKGSEYILHQRTVVRDCLQGQIHG